MSALDDLTLGQLKITNPSIYNFISVQLLGTYDEFVACVLDSIEKAVKALEGSASQLKKREAGEDLITINLVSYLKGCGFQVYHDAYQNGHCDVVVENARGFQWLGESKIHSSYEWLLGGFGQLVSRYSPGTVTSNRGGLLIFIKVRDAASVMKSWRDLLSASGLEDLVVTSDANNDLRFDSQHKHTASGLTYHVRHFGIVLHYDPVA